MDIGGAGLRIGVLGGAIWGEPEGGNAWFAEIASYLTLQDFNIHFLCSL